MMIKYAIDNKTFIIALLLSKNHSFFFFQNKQILRQFPLQK